MWTAPFIHFILRLFEMKHSNPFLVNNPSLLEHPGEWVAIHNRRQSNLARAHVKNCFFYAIFQKNALLTIFLVEGAPNLAFLCQGMLKMFVSFISSNKGWDAMNRARLPSTSHLLLARPFSFSPISSHLFSKRHNAFEGQYIHEKIQNHTKNGLKMLHLG